MAHDDSRLDAKLARDALIAEGLNDLWDALCAAVQATSDKINAAWHVGLVTKINDGNSVIRVTAPTRSTVSPDRMSKMTPELELRFDRSEKKVVSRLAHVRSSGTPYRIVADVNARQLLFAEGRVQQWTPLALAEHLVAEDLLGIKLDD